MKTIFRTLFLLFISSGILFAQDTKSAQKQEQNIENELLKAYYSVKDALTADNAKLAAEKAKTFVLKADSTLKISQKEKELRMQLKESAQKIAASEDLAKQREAFSDLSEEMATFVKSTGNWAKKVYKQSYTTVEKGFFWLSEKIDPKNPYTGKEVSKEEATEIAGNRK